jgi:hypothetical protein
LYTISHKENNINNFYEKLFNSGFEIQINIIPALLFHLDSCGFNNTNTILEFLQSDKLKQINNEKLISLVIEYKHDQNNQLQINTEILDIIEKWKASALLSLK